MADGKSSADEEKPKGAPKPAPSDKEARRAAALRENLKRRKEKPPPEPADGGESAP